MIGVRLTEGKATYDIVGGRAGRWIVRRVDAHEPPFEATAGELASRFDVEQAAPVEPDEQEAWVAFGAANHEAVAADWPEPKPTPEDVFAAIEQDTPETPEPRKRGLDAAAKKRLGHATS